MVKGEARNNRAFHKYYESISKAGCPFRADYDVAIKAGDPVEVASIRAIVLTLARLGDQIAGVEIETKEGRQIRLWDF